MSGTFSLRRRLLLLLLSAVTMLWLVVAILSYFDTHHEIDEIFDAQLAQSAQVLLMIATHEESEAVPDYEHQVEQHPYEQKVAFQIWNAERRLLLRSTSAPQISLSEAPSGFSDSVIEGRLWRVFSRWDVHNEIQVQVGERHDVRNELAGKIALRMLFPLLLTLPFLAALIWASTRRGLAPLERVSHEVTQRDPQHPEPLAAQDIPEEILPLVKSLNVLFERVQQAFENERRFTADAAHELRTPLAALKTQAQVALRADSDEARKDALRQVIEGVDRAAHLVQQLLTLSRIESGTVQIAVRQVDLRQVAADAVAQAAPLALAKKIELALEEGGSAAVEGDAVMLGVLARNLVDNAIRYTPDGGAVTVGVTGSAGKVALQVVDTGSGIPENERKRVFDRFYRILGTEQTGSGLGLSIVKRIADLHRAEIRLEEGRAGRGLRVTVTFALAL